MVSRRSEWPSSSWMVRRSAPASSRCVEAVAKSVRMQGFVDAGAFGGFPTGVPDDLVADRSVGRVMRATREQPNGRFAG